MELVFWRKGKKKGGHRKPGKPDARGADHKDGGRHKKQGTGAK